MYDCPLSLQTFDRYHYKNVTEWCTDKRQVTLVVNVPDYIQVGVTLVTLVTLVALVTLVQRRCLGNRHIVSLLLPPFWQPS